MKEIRKKYQKLYGSSWRNAEVFIRFCILEKNYKQAERNIIEVACNIPLGSRPSFPGVAPREV